MESESYKRKNELKKDEKRTHFWRKGLFFFFFFVSFSCLLMLLLAAASCLVGDGHKSSQDSSRVNVPTTVEDHHNTMLKVAIVGSTGGGSATLSSGELVVQSIEQHLESIHNSTTGQRMVDLSFVALVCSDVGMDFAQSSTSASLWTMNHESPSLTKSHRGQLQDINVHLRNHVDPALAALIEEGSIDVVISISSDPEGNNAQAFAAAVRTMIPIVGTGGTSISQIATMGGNVIGCSGGSVATTAVTRGICFAASIAAHFKLAYTLPHPPKMAKFQSVVGAALPLLLAVSLFKSSFPLWPRGGIQWIVNQLAIDGTGDNSSGSSGVEMWLDQLNWSVENKVLLRSTLDYNCCHLEPNSDLTLPATPNFSLNSL